MRGCTLKVGHLKSGNPCRNLYAFIRLRLGDDVSDREIARRWSMEWKSFNALRHGQRQVPRIAELELLARLLKVDAAFVFEVARGVSARKVHSLLQENDSRKLARLLMAGVLATQREAASRSQQYRAILDRVSDGVFTMDVQGRFQDVNRRLATLTGFTSAELLERSLFDLLIPAQRPELVARATAVYQTGEVQGATFNLRAKKGTQLIVELGLTRIDDDRGQAIGIQGVAHDVTERTRLEDALERQLATLRTTFDAVPAASLLFARDGTILLANRPVEDVCKWTAEEIVGRNAFEVFGNPGAFGCPVTRAFESGKLEQQVSRMRNAKGHEVLVHRIAGPVLGAKGQVDQVVEILVDVGRQVDSGDPFVASLWDQGNRPLSADEAQRLADREQRRFLRVPLDVAVQYRAGRRRGEGVARNLGRGGICLLTSSTIPVGAEVGLQWQLPGRQDLVKANGFVVWADPADSTGRRGVGIVFSKLAAPHVAAIARCVGAIRRRGRGATRRRGSASATPKSR